MGRTLVLARTVRTVLAIDCASIGDAALWHLWVHSGPLIVRNIIVFDLCWQEVQIVTTRHVEPLRGPLCVRGKNCLYIQDWIPEFHHDSFTLLSSQTHSFHVICHHLRSNSSSAVRKTIRLAGRNGAPGKWCSLHKCSAAPLSARIPPIRTTHAGLDRMIAWKWLSYILRSIAHLAGLDMRRVSVPHLAQVSARLEDSTPEGLQC